MGSLATLEHQALAALLQGDDEILHVLRHQAKEVSVSSRKMTGVGFFIEFDVPPHLPRIKSHPTFTLGDVNGTAENVKHGLGFVLFIKDGALSVLEGYSYDEPWPDEPRNLALAYSTGQNRDLVQLKKTLRGE